MALFLKQDEDQRSRLQEKIAAQLRERSTASSKNIKAEKPEPAFLENQHTTNPAGIIWAIVALVVIGLLVWMVKP